MIWFFPSQHRILEEVRESAQLSLNQDATMRDWSYTYYSANAKTLVVGISFENRAEDVLAVSHEYGHCVQLISTEENFIPPLFRETCAFLAELIFLKYLAKFYPKLHMELIESWYCRNRHYLGKCSKILSAAKNTELQPYSYEWNYPIARVFSIVSFDNMKREEVWDLFSNSRLFLEKMSYCLKLESHKAMLSFLQPISVTKGGISGYALLGISAFGEAFRYDSNESRATISGFYCRYLSNATKENVEIKVDYLMGPAFEKRAVKVPAKKLKIVRNVNTESCDWRRSHGRRDAARVGNCRRPSLAE